MNRQEILRQIQEQSRFTYAQARKNAIHEAVLNNPLANSAAAGAASSGSSPSHTISFVVDTTDSLYFPFSFTAIDEPIEFTIDWGDGSPLHVDSGAGGFYPEEHTYAEVGEYTVKVKFDVPSKIIILNFPGDGDAVITSISGLQNLTSLDEFIADYNGLVSIDFSGMTSLTNIDISDCDIPGTNTPSLKEVILTGCTNLESLRVDDSDFSEGFPDLSGSGLTSLVFFDADQCGITGTIDLSGLPALRQFDLYDNPDLTSVIISSTQTQLGYDQVLLNLQECGLSETAVNNFLIALEASGAIDGELNINGGTNAIPTGAGFAALETLVDDRGWIINYND